MEEQSVEVSVVVPLLNEQDNIGPLYEQITNALTDKYEDLVKAGVIDPAKVTKTALANAASVSTLLLTSDALIAEKPKDGKKGHGGDYDMY